MLFKYVCMKMMLPEFESRIHQASDMVANAAYSLYVDTGVAKALDAKLAIAKERTETINAIIPLTIVLRSNGRAWPVSLHNLYDKDEKLSLYRLLGNAKQLLEEINTKRGFDLPPLTAHKIDELIAMLDRHETSKKELATLRDQHLAHLDPRRLPYHLRRESAASDPYNSAHAMTETALEIIEGLQSYCLFTCWIRPNQEKLEKETAEMIDVVSKGMSST